MTKPLASSTVRSKICVPRFSIFSGTETAERGQKWLRRVVGLVEECGFGGVHGKRRGTKWKCECGESVCGYFFLCLLGVN